MRGLFLPLVIGVATTVAAQEEPTPVPPAVPAAGPAEATPVPAALPGPSRDVVAERRRELSDLKRRLAELRVRYAATRKREADLKAELDAAELNLQIRTTERRVLELRRDEAEKGAKDASSERDRAAALVTGLQSDLSVRLSALHRMGRIGYLRTLAAAESGRTFLRGLQLLSHMARRDANLLSTYQRSLADLKSRETDLASRRLELTTLAAESRQKEAELAAARAEKAALLARVQRTSEQERVAVVTLEDKSVRLAALLDLLEAHGRALPAGATSIRRYKGVLDWPAKGKVVVPFGRIANPRFPKTFLRSNGWTLEVPPGTEVQAVFAGDVVFAQWLKGYGNLVVLDHGDGVFTLYGRLSTGTVQKGERVGLGERVGRLAEPSVDDEVEGLTFEIRDARASVDPRLWLK